MRATDKSNVKKEQKVRLSISIKLVLMTTLLLVVVGSFITYESTNRFEKSSKDRELSANIQQARARSNEVEGLLVTYIDKIKVIASQLLKEYPSAKERQQSLALTFYGDRDIVSVEVHKVATKKAVQRVVNKEFLAQYGLDERYIDEGVRSKQEERKIFQKEAVFAGKVEIRNASFKADLPPLVTIGVPFVKDDYGDISHIAVAEIRLDRLQKIFGVLSARTTFLVDREGYLLAHPEESRVLASQSFKGDSMVWQALNSDDKEGASSEAEFDPDGVSGAFNKTSLGVIVITSIPNAVILEVSEQVRYASIRIAGQILSVFLFFVFLFSISLTQPIEKLVEVTTAIAKGDFEVRANVHSQDEVGLLGSAIDNMVVGLKERDKVKNVLNKFHGSSVTDELIKGELELGGSSKHVTVFFSDIRDFTKFSEAHTAEQVVSMLNEYFQVMVGIINRNNGVVDKFIGDAIMAVWGAPNPSDRDAQDSVKACLEMRMALEELNKLRVGRGEIPLKIGIGLHTGSVISGNIGSDERMEYTVIGDAVNQAARIEASTKAFGADLLLSEETAELVGEEFMVTEAGRVEVKGKSNALALYKVRGYFNEEGEEVELRTEWSDYEAGDADKVKMAS